MKSIFAHIKKDAITCRTLLCVWAACLAVDFVFSLVTISPLAKGTEATFAFKSIAICLAFAVMSSIIVQFIVLGMLIVRIVQEDSLQDADAFWRTRPFSRMDLLKEKAIFVVGLGGGTFLAMLAIHMTGGYDFIHMMVYLTGLFAFAAVTTSLSKLILNALGIAVVSQIAASIVILIIQYIARTVGIVQAHLITQSPQYGEVSGIYIVGFIAVVIFQYLTLKTNASRYALFGILLVAAVLQGI